MSSKQYDVIVIGGGHNGLVAAAYLAKAGKRVLVLERRERLGGSLDDAVQSGTLRRSIARDLGLDLPAPNPQAGFISLLPDGRRLALDADPLKTAASLREFSPRDAQRWPEFVRFMDRAAAFLEKSYGTLIPTLPRPALKGAADLAQLGLSLRGLGRRDMLNTIRALAMSAAELVEEYFESNALRAALASLGVHNATLGPLSAGTGFNLIHHWMIRGGLAQRYSGQAQAVVKALEAAARANGAEIRMGAEVDCIDVDNYHCRGVRLAGSEEIPADCVLSSADPRRTFLGLVQPVNLPPDFVWKVQSIKMRGSAARVHLGVEALPEGLEANATYVVAPAIRYLEKAYDAAKYGNLSEQPYLEVTTLPKAVSIHFQFAPYSLRGSTWMEQRSKLEEIAMGTLEAHFPGLSSRVRERTSLTPLDLEQEYGLSEGDVNHGQLMLDQLFFMRPVPGYANQRTPVDGLFLCGSGVHGGGGISGIAGRNAAKIVRKEDWRKTAARS